MRRALAVDLGGTELRAALVDEAGGVAGFVAAATDSGGGPEAVVAQIAGIAGGVLRDGGAGEIVGLGIAAPGPLDPVAGLALAPPTLAGWRNVPLAALVERRLGLPVRLANDANAAALGEWRFGAGRGTRDMVFVTVSTGIGGGIVAGGRLLLGARGLAGEIGHMTVDATSAETLFGGAPGTWEALASGTALGRDATRRAVGPEGAVLREHAGGGPVTARHVVEAARTGDALALDLLAGEARWLGLGFANLLHLYAPERIVVGGGVAAGLDLMAPLVAATIRGRALPPYRDVPVVAAALGRAAGLVGAASLFF